MKTQQKQDLFAYFEELLQILMKLDAQVITSKEGDKLYTSEIHLLDKIDKYPDLNMSELARELNVTRGMVSQLALKLEKKGFLVKKASSSNKRDLRLELTELGDKVIILHDKFHKDTNKDIEAYLTSIGEENKMVIYDFLDFIKAFMIDLSDKRTE